MKEIINLLTANKNLILTGAPGTGKTYLAKEIAEAMGATESNGNLGFVQFHPSYDYTDFVEGLRPTPPDENVNIGFERKNGVFKEFCKKALNATQTGGIDNFEEAWKKMVDAITEAFNNGNEYKMESSNCKVTINTQGNPVFNGSPVATYETTYKKYKNETTNLKYETYQNIVIKHLKEKYELNDYKQGKFESPQNDKHFIFIIDEINRGEISKIFGELFFSIDPSYRGEKGRVQTQYANLIDDGDVFKNGFFVPENVYIIGTMNDIDRSVESFDFAMRRRFMWKEITAKDSQKMFEGETWKDVAIKRMDAINNVIWNDKDNHIEGLNSSFHIGGAYFKNNLPKYLDTEGIITDDSWKNLWEYHIEPLLKEYLRGMSDAENQLNKLKQAYDKVGQAGTTDTSNEDENNG